MKSILQSIKPQYCLFIAYGIECPVPIPNSNKRYEVRKNMPKLPTPFKSYVYCTKSDDKGCYPDGSYHWLGKVPFEYVCDYIKVIQALPGRNEYDISADDLKQTHLSQKELWEYGKGKPLYLWHISNLKIYDKPKELSEFVKYDFALDYEEWEHYAIAGINGKEPDINDYRLTRPFQSWGYIDEIN